jgi:ABC-type sugar transport system ATPase subunit
MISGMLGAKYIIEQVMTTLNPALQIRGLTKHYGGVKAQAEAGLRLMHGENAAIVGDNGAAKRILVRLITGAIDPAKLVTEEAVVC